MSNFSIGRLVAFFIGSALAVVIWGMVFVPGGLGSNIILGIFGAVISVYWITGHFGNVLDIWIFNRGSSSRAAALILARKTLHEAKAQLKATKSLRTAGQFSPVLVQLEALELSINEIGSSQKRDEALARIQVARLNEGSAKVKRIMAEVFGKKPHKGGWLSLTGALLAALALRAFVVEPYQIPSGSMIPTLAIGDHLFVSKLSFGIVNPFSSPGSYFVRWSTPKPGEVIVFEAPSYVGLHAGSAWIKRVIAGPGQTISVRNAMVYVDNKPYPHTTPEELVSYMNYFEGQGAWQQDEATQTTEEIGSISHRIFFRSSDDEISLQNNWPLGQSKTFPGLKCDYSKCTVDDGYLFVMGDNRGGSKDSRFWGGLPIEMVKGKALFIWMSVDGSQNMISWGKYAVPAFRFDRWFTAIR